MRNETMTQQLTDHRTGTREEWLAARGELAKLEAVQAERNKEIVGKRQELPWGPVEKEFAFDFGLAITQEQAQQVPEVKEMIENPPDWLQEWSGQVGAPLKDGLRETPGWIAFARENGTVYHTYTVTAPDPFVAPYFSFLLERTPKAQPANPPIWRKDEYPD